MSMVERKKRTSSYRPETSPHSSGVRTCGVSAHPYASSSAASFLQSALAIGATWPPAVFSSARSASVSSVARSVSVFSSAWSALAIGAAWSALVISAIWSAFMTCSRAAAAARLRA